METKASKFFLKSKGCGGGIVAVIFMLLPALGFSVTPEDLGLAEGAVENIIAAIGVLVSVYGRVVAKERVHIIKPKEGTNQ